MIYTNTCRKGFDDCQLSQAIYQHDKIHIDHVYVDALIVCLQDGSGQSQMMKVLWGNGGKI